MEKAEAENSETSQMPNIASATSRFTRRSQILKIAEHADTKIL